jgi:succinate dehydrogenase/fumarate reductase-like Fe-S protein
LAEPLDNIPTEEELNIKKQFFLDKLGKIDRYELERTTKDQSHSQEWYTERKKKANCIQLWRCL